MEHAKPLLNPPCSKRAAVLIAAGIIALGFAAMFALSAPAGEDRNDRSSHRPKKPPCLNFSELRLALEQNATDGDTEVVLFAKGQDAGLDRLLIISPDGRTVADFHGDRRGIGLREFQLESAEPPDLQAVLQSFPEGNYSVVGRTVQGDCMTGTVFLSHEIAPATVLLTPQEEEVVPIDQVVLRWEAVPGTERYVVELNNETTGSEFTFQIFPPVTSLPVPAHFLQPGSEYQFGVGAKLATGNITFVETTFFTSP